MKTQTVSKRLSACWLAACLMGSWGAVALPIAQAANDYAQEWPLTLSRSDAGAYRVTLDAQVYAAVHWQDLNDIRVLDADGQEVPSTIIAATPYVSQTVELAWFPNPVVLQERSNYPVPATPARATPETPTASPDPAWLIDTRNLPGVLRTIVVQWQDPTASFDVAYRLEGSTDQIHWRVLQHVVRLLQLHHQGRELHSNRIDVRVSAPYLRLVPVRPHGNPLVGTLRGEILQPLPDQDWQWLEPHFIANVPGQTDAPGQFNYRVQGRFPIQRVDVRMPANSAAVWAVSSREEGSGALPERDNTLQAAQVPVWTPRVRDWITLSVTDTMPALDRSQMLRQAVLDPLWRLQADAGTILPTAPALRLGYLADSVIFLAQGRAPWVLVAGSAQRAAPHMALDALEPAAAHLGLARPRAGIVAYQPAPRDWTVWMLWAVLILGTIIIAGLALRLLRMRL